MYYALYTAWLNYCLLKSPSILTNLTQRSKPFLCILLQSSCIYITFRLLCNPMCVRLNFVFGNTRKCRHCHRSIWEALLMLHHSRKGMLWVIPERVSSTFSLSQTTFKKLVLWIVFEWNTWQIVGVWIHRASSACRKVIFTHFCWFLFFRFWRYLILLIWMHNVNPASWKSHLNRASTPLNWYAMRDGKEISLCQYFVSTRYFATHWTMDASTI